MIRECNLLFSLNSPPPPSPVITSEKTMTCLRRELRSSTAACWLPPAVGILTSAGIRCAIGTSVRCAARPAELRPAIGPGLRSPAAPCRSARLLSAPRWPAELWSAACRRLRPAAAAELPAAAAGLPGATGTGIHAPAADVPRTAFCLWRPSATARRVWCCGGCVRGGGGLRLAAGVPQPSRAARQCFG